MKKFNIIDVIVVLLIISVGIGAYLYLTKDKSVSTVETGKTEVTFIAQADGILESVVDTLKVGDQIIGNGYYEDGKIVDLKIEDSYKFDAVDGEYVLVDIADRKKITVTITGKANKYGPYVDLAGQEIKGGSKYIIRTKSFEASGQILTVLEN